MESSKKKLRPIPSVLILIISNISLVYFFLMYILETKLERSNFVPEPPSDFVQNLLWIFLLYIGIVCLLEYKVYIPQMQKRTDATRNLFMLVAIANSSAISIVGIIYGFLYMEETHQIPWIILSVFFLTSMMMSNYIYFSKIRSLVSEKTQ